MKQKFITRPLIKSFGFETACSAGVLLGLGNFKKFTIIYLTHHVWFGVTVCVLRGGGVQISFSSQSSAAPKIKYGSYNFHQDNA